MKSLKERLEKKIESNAWKYDTAVGGSCHMPSYKEGAASLVPLVVELEQLTQDTKEFLYLLQEDMEFYKESACLPTQDEIDQVRIHRQIVIEALQSIEKLMGEK